MSIVRRAAIRLAGNALVQQLLEKTATRLQALMGIGAGGEVASSGEEAALVRMRQRSSPPYCVFDVGANQGQYLQLVLQTLPGDGAFVVHCFEPSTFAYDRLSRLRQRIPSQDRVKLNNLALGRRRGEVELYYHEPGSGLASLTKRRLGHLGIDVGQSETVHVDSLDNYCADNGVERIDLLKVDVEGHELDVLEGASGMIERRRIGIVAFEFGGCNIDTRTYFQDFYYFFKGADMAIFRITASGYLHPIESYREIYEQFRTTNFVAMAS